MHALVLMTAVLSTLSAEPSPQPAVAHAPAAESTAAPAAIAQRTFDEFLVIRKDGERIEGRNGALSDARLTGTAPGGARVELLRDDIKTLYSKEGSQAGVMALCGGGVGLALSGITLLRLGLDNPTLFNSESASGVALGFVAGSTALGALIGLAVGAGTSNWRIEPVVLPGRQYSARLSLSL